jgi:hypothetical protein
MSRWDGDKFERFLPYLAVGEKDNYIVLHKFGRNPASALNTEEIIWDRGAGYFWPTSANVSLISSADNSDGQVIEIEGLDHSWERLVQQVTLTGQTPVTLSHGYRRVNRMKNLSGNALAGVVAAYQYTTDLSSGLPTNTSLIASQITTGFEQTEQTIYTIPRGYTGWMMDWWASSAWLSAAYTKIKLYAREASSQVFRVHEAAVAANPLIQHRYIAPRKFTEKSDIYLSGEASSNNIVISGGFCMILRRDVG